MKRSSQRWILLIVWLSVSFKYKGEVLCHLHKLIAGKTRCKIHTEESNKLTAKNVKRIDFELHQLFTIWILSRNGAVWNVWYTVNMTPIKCHSNPMWRWWLGQNSRWVWEYGMGCYVYFNRSCHCKVVFPLLLTAEKNVVCLGEFIKKTT